MEIIIGTSGWWYEHWRGRFEDFTLKVWTKADGLIIMQSFLIVLKLIHPSIDFPFLIWLKGGLKKPHPPSNLP